MNEFFSQASRRGQFFTVLGDDELVLQRFEGTDHLNSLYIYHVDCLAAVSDVDFDKLLGTHATVSLQNRHGALKYFDGIVTATRWLGAGDNGHKYRLTLKPWVFLASLRRNQRIFHNKTVPEILNEVLSFYSAPGLFQNALIRDYPKLEYTVQYRESDLAFVCRLMERFGISYHFKHEAGAHTMVLTDATDAHENIGDRPFKPNVGHHQEDIEHFWEWGPMRRITTGAIRLADYNFKTPQAAMETEAFGTSSYENGDLESFDWPGHYLDHAEGQLVAKLRTESEAGQEKRYEAFGDIPDLGAGVMVGLSGDPVPGTGGEYLCLSAIHSYTSDNYGSGGMSGDGYAYTGRYVLMPSDAPLMPELKTPLADVRGPQTATVVGDGEVDCDEYGRILVRFHWDLANAYSMRCRVSQSWAGSSWGGMVIPRIGMEVVVEFLDGDPDKPLVTGCVYNGREMPPMGLPFKRTQSIFRTNSVGGNGYNELSFEDKAGAETIFMHAQKDQSLKVLNNRLKRVDNDQIESVGSNKSIDVTNNHQEKIGGSMNLSVGGGGGALGLIGSLGGLLGGGVRGMAKGVSAIGNPMLSKLVNGLVPTALVGEKVSSPGITGFMASGPKALGPGRGIADVTKIAAGTQLGQMVGQIMPVSGVKKTFVEKMVSDTIGFARTEQVGLMKNTVVGQMQTTSVGKTMNTRVGEDYHLVAKKSIFNRTVKHTLHATDKFIIGGPGGTIIIDQSGVTIKAKKVNIKAPISISSGAPDQVDALDSDKAFAQECKTAAENAKSKGGK